MDRETRQELRKLKLERADVMRRIRAEHRRTQKYWDRVTDLKDALEEVDEAIRSQILGDDKLYNWNRRAIASLRSKIRKYRNLAEKLEEAQEKYHKETEYLRELEWIKDQLDREISDLELHGLSGG